jgi:DNA polymerase III epsilon subunit-like protein
MEKYLFLDTETTGLNAQKDHIVQLAWLLTNSTGKLFYEKSILIKPNGYKVPDNMIHGISHEKAELEGKPLKTVLQYMGEHLGAANNLVAHNAKFDFGFVSAADATVNAFDVNTANHFFDLRSICTMTDRRILKYFKLRQSRISLKDLHFRLFHEHFEDAHDALADTRACARCFFELKNRQVL